MTIEAPRFVGREREIDGLARWFEGGVRVLTVLGPAGAGKTRLVREWRRRLGQEVVWCDLTEARSREDVEGVVGRALDVPMSESEEQLGHAISTRGATVFVLDNVEQLVSALQTVLPGWLALAPGARFVATSRAPLAIAAERRFELAPLTDVESAELFAARAEEASRPIGDREVIARIVSRLDGNPLAIELCAGRLGILSTTEVLQRLDRSLELLRAPSAEVERHRTLERAIDDSWGLLGESEQRALAECALFHGGFTVEAAEAILSPDDDAPVLDRLHTLKDRSLLRPTVVSPSGLSRHSLYESIRAYAAKKLELLGGRADVEGRAEAWFLAKAERAVDRYGDIASEEAERGLADELDNLLAIQRRATGDAVRRAALALHPLWSRQGPYERDLAGLDAALEVPSDDAWATCRLGLARGECNALRGQMDEAESDLGCAVAIAEEIADERLIVRTVHALGTVVRDRGQFERAGALFRRAREVAKRAGDRLAAARATADLAWIERDEPSLRDALATAAALSARRLEIAARGALGIFEYEADRIDAARNEFRLAASMARELCDRRLDALMTTHLAITEVLARRLDEARAILSTMLPLQRELGNGRYEAVVLVYLGTIAWEKGSLDEATELLSAARVRAATLDFAWVESFALAQLGGVLADRGEVDRAASALEAATARGGALGGPDYRLYLALQDGLVDVARARAARDPQETADFRNRAAARLADASHEKSPRRSAQLRLGIRAMERALRGEASASDMEEGSPFEVGPESEWIRSPLDAARVDLRGRRILRSIVELLVVARLETPGRAVSAPALVRHAWPGERLKAKSATNRLHNAIATVRTLGFRHLLVRQDDGYLLDPRFPLVRRGF